MRGLTIGDMFRVRSIRNYFNGTDWAEFKHPDKDKVLCLLLLGEESKKAPGALEPNKVLEALGWRFLEKLKVNAKFEVEENGVIGSKDAKVKRFEIEDDGSITVVLDHWPTE